MRINVFHLAGLMWELRERSWVCLPYGRHTANSRCWLITSRGGSVAGITVDRSTGLSASPWFGPRSLSNSRGTPVHIPTPHHHQNFASDKAGGQSVSTSTQGATPQGSSESPRIGGCRGLRHTEISARKQRGNSAVRRALSHFTGTCLGEPLVQQ